MLLDNQQVSSYSFMYKSQSHKGLYKHRKVSLLALFFCPDEGYL